MDSSLPNLLMISGDCSVATGREGAFYYLLERFSRYWGRIDIILPKPSLFIRNKLFDNVFLHPATMPRILQGWHILREGKRLHAERAYSLMTSHDYGWHYNGLGAWLLHRATGTPYVSEIHHLTGYPRAGTVKEWMQGVVGRCYVRAVRDTVRAFRVVNSVELPELLSRLGVPRCKIITAYSLYIDHDAFRPAHAVKQFDIMYCGRLDWNKGTDILFKAVALLVAKYPDMTLLMRASGSREKMLKYLAARLGIESRIVWWPWVTSAEELAGLYRASKILVCTSRSEGGPRVAVEAMACGTPVVTTPVGIMRELIIHGVTGLLADWSAQSVAANVERLLSDTSLCSSIAKAGRLTVMRFRRDTVIEAYASSYLRLAAETSIARANPSLS